MPMTPFYTLDVELLDGPYLVLVEGDHDDAAALEGEIQLAVELFEH